MHTPSRSISEGMASNHGLTGPNENLTRGEIHRLDLERKSPGIVNTLPTKEKVCMQPTPGRLGRMLGRAEIRMYRLPSHISLQCQACGASRAPSPSQQGRWNRPSSSGPRRFSKRHEEETALVRTLPACCSLYKEARDSSTRPKTYQEAQKQGIELQTLLTLSTSGSLHSLFLSVFLFIKQLLTSHERLTNSLRRTGHSQCCPRCQLRSPHRHRRLRSSYRSYWSCW